MMRSSLFLSLLLACCFAFAFGQNQPTSCCAPRQWTISGTEKTNFGLVSHFIAYDAVNQYVRWDRKGYIESSTSVLSLSLYSFYPQGIEYVVDVTTQTCLPYGPDGFVDWCFGKGSNMLYAFNMTIAGSSNINWVSVGNPAMNWVSDSNCFPVYFQDTDSTTLFYSPSLGVNPNNFVLPSYCNTTSTKDIPRSAPSPLSSLLSQYFGGN